MAAGKTIRKAAVYPYPPEKIWVALTDPRAIAEWLMPNNFRAEVGHKFYFQVDGAAAYDGRTDCEVIEVDPPRRLAYTWTQGANRPRGLVTTVTWTLASEGRGTRLTLEHTGVEIIPWLHRLMLRFGWGTMVKRWIMKVAANVGDDGAFTPGAIPLRKRCYGVKTIPDELVR